MIEVHSHAALPQRSKGMRGLPAHPVYCTNEDYYEKIHSKSHDTLIHFVVMVSWRKYSRMLPLVQMTACKPKEKVDFFGTSHFVGVTASYIPTFGEGQVSFHKLIFKQPVILYSNFLICGESFFISFYGYLSIWFFFKCNYYVHTWAVSQSNTIFHYKFKCCN